MSPPAWREDTMTLHQPTDTLDIGALLTDGTQVKSVIIDGRA